MTEIADPSTYAKLPAGTRVLFGELDAATEALKFLKDADQIGVTGKTASFVECTRLIDTEKKYISDMPEGPDKEFVFLDDPGDANLTELLDKADSLQSVKMRFEFPNGRWADITIVLGGWSLQELDKSKPMYIVVNAKQNAISRGISAPVS